MKNIKYLFIALALISCTKKNNSAKFTAVAAPGNQTIEIPICGTIDMTPASALYAPTTVNFQAVLPAGDVQALVWVFKKGDKNIYSSGGNTVSHVFNGPAEGVGTYTAELSFRKADGNSCALKKSFQILKDDICAPPTGISGPSIGYVGEEVSFNVNSEPCFQGQLKWDMQGDDVTDFTTTPYETVKYTYNQPGTYTVRTNVIHFEDDQAQIFSYDIEIRNKTCTHPFTGTPVQNGNKVRFAKRSDQCGQGGCDSIERTCNNGVFDGDESYNENPATCPISQPCAVVWKWEGSEFGQCTGACDSASGTRSVNNYVCKKTQNGTTTTVSDGQCTTQVGPKPSGKTETCNVLPEDQAMNCQSCGTIPHHGTQTKWAQAPTCGTSCSAQTQTCNNGTIPAFDFGYTFTDEATCPVTTCYTYTWKTSDYGACSAVQCGTQGTQTRNVACTRNDGVAVADSFCSGTKPEATKACAARACYSCNLPWGGTIAHTASTTAYQASTVACGATCTPQTRTCNDGTLSGSFVSQSCSVNTCPPPPPPITPVAKGSSCYAFAGTSIKWTDSATGKACGGNLMGSVMAGDYMQVGGSELDPNTQWMIPWDKATYKGSAKITCSESVHDMFGGPSFVVVSGTCSNVEPNLIPSPKVNAAMPATCFASPIAQQAYGAGTCAVYRQVAVTDMPMKAVGFNNGIKKYPNLGEYTDSFEQVFTSSQGKIYTSAGVAITYGGQTRTLATSCGSNDVAAANNSTCSNQASVTVGGVTFSMGVGARNTIDPTGYKPPYVSGFPNSSQVWTERMCGVVTMSSSLGYLPPPCP